MTTGTEKQTAAIERQVVVLTLLLILCFVAALGSVGGTVILAGRLAELEADLTPTDPFGGYRPTHVPWGMDGKTTGDPDRTAASDRGDRGSGQLDFAEVIEAREFRVVTKPGDAPLVRIGSDRFSKAFGGGWIEISSGRGVPLARLRASDDGHGELQLYRIDGARTVDVGVGLSGIPSGVVMHSPDNEPYAWLGFDHEGGFGWRWTEHGDDEESRRRTEQGIDF